MASGKATFDGGYPCEFVKQPAKELQTECSICLLVLRSPNLVSCCGEKFCHGCIQQVTEKNKPCPVCNCSQFTVMADKKLERDLLGLKVYCVNKDKGCKWKGDLRDLGKHCSTVAINSLAAGAWTTASASISEGCEYEMVECTVCKEPIQRSKLNAHMSKSCIVPDGECRFKFAGCKEKISSKNLKHHLEDNMALHLSLVMDFTRNLSGEHVRMSEYLATLSSEVLDQGVLQQERREVALQRNQEDGRVLQPQRRVGRRRWGRSLLLWIGGSLLIGLLGFVVAQNRDALVAIVVNMFDYPIKDNVDESEVYLALADMEDKMNTMTENMKSLTQSVASNAEKIQAMMVDMKTLEKAVDGWREVSQNLKLQVPDDLKFKFDKLSSDVASVKEGMVARDSIEQLQQKLNALTGLQNDVISMQNRITNMPLPISQAEIKLLVVNELEARRPPHPPPHHHHPPPHHHHGHGGCRGHR